MEFESLTTINTNSLVLLCKTCYEQGDYFIPTYVLNLSDEIEYKCPKNHIIGKKDVIMALLDEDIKGRLTRCNNEEHINPNSNDKNKLCVWCDDSQKNLCELDFENDTEHNYILYTLYRYNA